MATTFAKSSDAGMNEDSPFEVPTTFGAEDAVNLCKEAIVLQTDEDR
jgi:hypothetical protein